ncbi:MAG: GHMP kinase [Candidatus Altiarchaeales archaeon]|nr:MAG: GHMP kinase [Candidatus Altiarchaeales archaeon]RLI95551.1 MAG: GHMP kinase [Candidatus Altiarchaeales archaeon]RLI95590.1 MAG: GHMP kinase [Candidatus Altiarchaeales archaeon]HDO82544.1 GHMP kinase [Candidatus Altiarchaeales archaeon]HEX55193.1 GHMP kinase [Candidatus Altiarchaeales archaeon]
MNSIRIIAPAHLHVGNIDMNGDLGRLYGTVGFTIDFPRTIIEISKSSEGIEIIGNDSENARKYANIIIRKFNIDDGFKIHIRDNIPVGIGMGSQTALSLSIGIGILRLCNMDFDMEELALCMGRSKITALGINSFRYGGFLIDAGYRINEKGSHVPPLIFRQDIPEDWLFIVCIPEKPIPKIMRIKEREDEILESLEVMERELSCELSRIVLMQMMPSIIERNIETFGKSITALNRKLGNFWDEFQSDIYCDPIVSRGIKMMEKFTYGVCQSCWGPTFYGILDSEERARKLVNVMQRFLNENGGGEVFYTKPNNRGAISEWSGR